jgi:hypothetical protein
MDGVPASAQRRAYRLGDPVKSFGMHDDDGARPVADERGQLAEYPGTDRYLMGSFTADVDPGQAH